MDWLRKLLGGIGNFAQGAVRNVQNTVGQAGNAVQNEIKQAPQQVQQVQRAVAPRLNIANFTNSLLKQAPKPSIPQLPQAPKININQLGNIGRTFQNAAGQFNSANDQLLKANTQAQRQIIRGINNNPVSQKINAGLTAVPNTRVQGLEQGWNTLNPGKDSGQITLGGVSHHLPVLSETQNINKQFNKDKNLGTVATEVGKTGAAYAPYFIGEGNLLKAGEGAGIAAKAGVKLVNNFVPGAGAQVISEVARGNRDPLNIAKESAIAGAFNAAPGLISPVASKGKEAIISKLTKTDFNAPQVVGTLAEKGKLLNDGYKNVKVEFKGNPGKLKSSAAVNENFVRDGAGKYAKNEKINPELNQLKNYQEEQLKISQTARPNSPEANGAIENYHAAQKQIDSIENPNIPAPIYENAPTATVEPRMVAKERGFIGTVKNSKSTAPEVASQVTADYIPKSNTKLVSESRKLISKDIEGARKVAQSDISDKGVATASELIKHYQAIGDYESAITVAQQAAKNLTEAGRTVQAASLYSRISPEGILRHTQAKIDAVGGKKLDPAVAKALSEQAHAVQLMADGPEKAFATAKLYQEINKQVPTGILKKLTTLRKAGLLTGFRTQAGNAVSNLSHIGLNKISDIPASGVDAMMGLFTGQRTKVLTGRGLIKGTAEGAKNAGRFMKTGVDEIGIDSLAKYDISPVNFKHKAVQKYVDTVFNAMGAADKPYRYAVLRNSLQDQAIAAAKTQGLKGAEAGKFVKSFVDNPPLNAAKVAATEAEKSVFGNDTVLSKAATGLRNAVEAKSPPAGAALDMIMPFTKVPSAVITRLFDFTPVGAVKEAAIQIKRGTFDQRAMAQALGAAGTGTGAIYLGVQLANAGMLTGSRPTDQKEAALWDMQGKQPNSIKFGNKWYSFNYTSPIGQVLQMGAGIGDSIKQGKSITDALASGAGQGAKAVVDQSFLQGVQGALDAVTDPERSFAKFAKSNVGSFVPTLVANAATALDPVQRQTNSLYDAVAARIPGFNLGLTPRVDAFGQPLKNQQQGLVGMIDPFKTSTENQSTPLSQELNRLQQAGVGILPDTTVKDITVGKEKIALSPTEANAFRATVGSQAKDAWDKITSSPEYASLTDDKKKSALQGALDDINAIEKMKLVATKNPELAKQMGQKLSARQQSVYSSGVVTGDYTLDKGASSSSGNSELDPKRKYQIALDKYTLDKGAGRITDVADINRSKELKRLQAQANFDANTNDLYSLSNKEIDGYLRGKPNGGDLWNQLVSLDDALVAQGFTSKFRDKKGNIRPLVAVAKGKGGKGKKGGKVTLASLKLGKAPSIKAAPSSKLRVAKSTSSKLRYVAPKSSSVKLVA